MDLSRFSEGDNLPDAISSMADRICFSPERMRRHRADVYRNGSESGHLFATERSGMPERGDCISKPDVIRRAQGRLGRRFVIPRKNQRRFV